MVYTPGIYLGIDPTASHFPYTWAVLDEDCHLLALTGGEAGELLAFLEGQSSCLAAINAPAGPNRGLVRTKLMQAQEAANLRGADMRLVEHLLRERGISVPPTPSRRENCAAWMQMGFLLHESMAQAGFTRFPGGEAGRQWIETNSHAAFCTLLGKIPLPKPTLEGRLQRQLAIHEKGGDIGDPMEFFEEITRHKILHGSLPMEYIRTAEELDALVAAFSAWMVINLPGETMLLGDGEEGQMVLPVKALVDHYN
jgi:hypothetical protein